MLGTWISLVGLAVIWYFLAEDFLTLDLGWPLLTLALCLLILDWLF